MDTDVQSLIKRRDELVKLKEAMDAKLKARPHDYGVRVWWVFILVGTAIGWLWVHAVWAGVLAAAAFWIAGLFFSVLILDSAEVQSRVAILLHRLGMRKLSQWLYARALTIR